MIFPNQLLETNVSAQAVIYIYMLVNTDVSSAKRALVFFLRDFKSEAKWNKIKLQSWVICMLVHMASIAPLRLYGSVAQLDIT